MRLPNTAHTSRPWRIHEITRDFRLEDVWALPTPGGPDDFPRLVEGIAAGDPAQSPSARRPRALGDPLEARASCSAGTTRTPASAPGCRRCATGCRPTCATRPPARTSTSLPFTSLYLLDDEWAAEIANRTVHGVMHIGWVPDGTGGYRGQMAVFVKPNGLLGQRLHGRDQAVPAPDRLPADAAPDRAGLAGRRRRPGSRLSAPRPGPRRAPPP